MRLQAVWIILLVVPVMGLLLPSSSNARVSSNNVVSQRNSNNIKSITSAQTSSTKLSMIEITNDFAIDASSLINAGFNIATFGPQPFWLLMCLLPNFSLTRKFMLPWTTVTFFALVHFAIVVASISEPEGTAPITEFTKVFDSSGDPLGGMMGMMKYKNFVSEEWSHVLTWDLLVGRYIWMDGLRRGIFTAHSVLLTNLIGPPGLLLHFLTCVVFGKGLPPVESILSVDEKSFEDSRNKGAISSSRIAMVPPLFRAETVIQPLLSNLFSSTSTDDRDTLLALCDDSTVWEYTNDPASIVGKSAIAAMLRDRAKNFPANARIVIDKVADGSSSCGFTFYLAQDGVQGRGLRSTVFFEFKNTDNSEKKIAYVREVAEPLFKPGSATSKLLRAVVSDAVKKDPSLAIRPPAPPKRATTSAPDLVRYLWTEINGSDKGLTLGLFDENIVYEDFNFEKPFVGKAEVNEFLDEFDIPGIKFIPEKFTDGRDGSTSCCFTWRVQVAGVAQSTRGISFYETNLEGTKVTYINDIPEPAIKPAPLQLIAGLLNPGLRRFKPL